MATDVSRKAVLILVVVAVLASVLSTSLVINAVYNYQPTNSHSQAESGPSSGRVTLTVPAAPPTAQGRVALEVRNPTEE